MSALAVLAGVAVFAGAFLQSAVGFGFSLVAAPLVLAAFGPEPAVGLMLAFGLEVNILTLLGERRRPDPLGRTVVAVLVASVPGMVVGLLILRNADALVLQAAVTVSVFGALALRRLGGGAPRVPAWAAGGVAGLMTTTTTTAGPPLVLLLLGRGLSPERVRDTLTSCFFGLSIIGATVLLVSGTRDAAPEGTVLAAMMPLALVGQIAGRPLFARLSGGGYEGVLTAVLVVSALAGLASAAI